MSLSQLRLLLWKNYTLRKRNKVRCLMEIAWPVCLFLLLALVRLKGFQTTIHQCHFEAKELPSAGPLLFYRSMICTLNNTCHKEPTIGLDVGHPLLLSALRHIHMMNDLNSSPIHSLVKFTSAVSLLIEELRLTSGMNTTDYDLTLTKLINDVDRQVDEVDDIVTVMETIDSIGTTDASNKIKDTVQNSPLINEIINHIHNFVCGNRTKITLDMFMDSKKSGYQPYIDAMSSNEEKWDENQGQSSECNRLFRELESSPQLGATWTIIKPYVRGKIVYSPDTPVVRRIIERIKISLSPPNLHIMEFQNHLLQIYPNLTKIMMNMFNAFETMSLNLSDSQPYGQFNYTSPKMLNGTLFKIHLTYKRFNESIYKIKKKSWNNLNISTLFKCYANVGRFEGYLTEEEATERSMKLSDNNVLLAQINFMTTSNATLDSIITYKIRMNTNRLPSSSQFLVNGGGPRFRPFSDLKLITLGFIYLQDAVERALIIELTGRQDLPSLSLNQLPHPCYIHDWFMTSVLNMFAMFMILSWVYTSSMIVKNIVFEKEQRLKETMRILGLSNSLLWLGWFLDSFFFLSFACCFLAIVLVYGGILAHADVTLIFVYLMTFSVATISTSFLISVFFSKANIAASSGGLIFFMLYLPVAFLEYWPSFFDYNTKLLMCLVSNVAFAMGSKHLAMLELDGIGARWSNIAEPTNSINILTIILFLLLDSLIYCVLAWYIEHIAPGDFGVPKKWYFLGTKEYWFGGKDVPLKGEKYPDSSSDKVEIEPHHLPRGVTIKNLTKVYSNGKVAVANLSLNFYESQITAFLGKNGAGKTTTLSVLTGLLPPTSGTAYIYNLDIRTDMCSVRKNLGICPQHNILFVKLTVEEQLWFYARLRGHTPGDAQLEVRQALSDLGLESKRNTPTSQLSGGMQRKLCIAIAFIGKSKTIILDEPTAGVDPFSRSAIWNLLLKYKFGRTIIMTTHSMTEAEVLSDRIAIFSSGRVLCNGSISFLRERFGRGYHLTIDRGMHFKNNEALSSSVLTKAIQEKMKEIEVIEEYGTEVKYSLPKLAGNIDNYSELFTYLSENKEVLCIQSFGLSDTSLEEIFVRLVDEDDLGTYNVDPPVERVEFPPCEKNFWKLGFKRIHALNLKRYHHFKRSKMLVFCGTLFPACFIALTLSITNSVPKLYQPSPKLIDVSNCGGCILFFQTNKTSMWTDKYAAEIVKPNGISSVCVSNSTLIPKGFPCAYANKNGTLNITRGNYLKDCSCSSGRLHCNDPTSYLMMPYYNMSRGCKMINATGIDISEWMLDTWQEFQDLRTGGYSLDNKYEVEETLPELAFIKSNSVPVYSSTDSIKIWFSNKWYLSPAVYLNAINNAILRASMANNTNQTYAIRLIYHPMNYTESQYQYEIVVKVSTALLHSVAVIFVLGFVPASYLIYVIEEKNNSKHLQFLFGINTTVYWTQAFLWDLMFYMLTTFVCILVYFAFYEEAYVANGNFLYMFLLFFFYGWACIPLMYLGSFLFNVPSSAFVTLSSFNIFIGITTSASTYVLRLFNDEDLTNIESILRNVFLIFPQFCLGEGMIKMAEIYLISAILKTYGSNIQINMFSWNYLGRNYFSMFLVGSLAFTLVLLVEHFRGKKICHEHLMTMGELPEGEGDVEAEKNRVLSGRDNDILVLKYLSKMYKREKNIAVNQLCLGVRKGECFGLLGINGAGKSTTFNMLTGKTSITFGDAVIDGKSVRYSMKKVKSKIGYCPQFDALDPLLTPREHLRFYTLLRGVPNNRIPEVVEQALTCFDLVKGSDITSKKLSGGYKRKLSTAVALLGNPQIVFMDEPTCGMDVKGRRFLWERLKDRVKNGATLVLTSHTLPECEVLCSRLTVMVRGRFTCLGSVQHLKNKYGKGYTMVVRAPFAQLNTAKEIISSELPEASEVCCYSEQIKYSLDLALPQLIKVFRTLEKLKNENVIYNYSVSQNSLEQVFLHFVNQQVFNEDLVQQSHSCANFCGLCKRRSSRSDSK